MPRHNQGPYLSDDRNEHGLYEIRWTENGRSKRKSTGQADRRAAQRVYAEFLLAISGDEVSTAVTVGAVIDAYLKDKTDVVDKSTQRNVFGYLKAHFGPLVVSEVEDDDVQDYRARRARGAIVFTDDAGRVRGGGEGGDSTARRELTMLATAIDHCIENRKFRAPDGQSLLTNKHRPVIKLPKANPPRDRWLSRDEATAFLRACQPDPAAPLTREYVYIATLLYTASRKAPVVRLAWPRIKLEHDPAKHEKGDYGMINLRAPGEAITRKRRGWVPIAAELYPILAQAEKERTSDFLLGAPAAGKPHPNEPYHAWRAAARRAGLVDPATGKLTVSPHVLRHTWATWAAQDGVPLYEIAGVLHDTVATVERIYAHHTPEHLRSAVNRRLLAA